MSHEESPFAAIDPPEILRKRKLSEYRDREPHAPDPGWSSGSPPDCPECGEPSRMEAFHDGEGWWIGWVHCDEARGDIDWPFGDRMAGPKDFEPLGTECV